MLVVYVAKVSLQMGASMPAKDESNLVFASYIEMKLQLETSTGLQLFSV